MTPGTILARRAAEHAARTSYGKLVAILAARDRDIAAAEDALSEALVSALLAWPDQGVPRNPEGWLITAARNRQKNAARAAGTRRKAEPELARRFDLPADGPAFPDDRLRLMFACAHPAIDPAAHAPLILQTILAFDATRIARVFLAEPAAMSQRLVRAKARIRDAGLRFELPEAKDLPGRLAGVLDAVYAAFGQGWDVLDQPDAPDSLSSEALWLARLIVALMPDEPEPKGLLALMLYCNARRAARRDAAGRFVPLDRQDPRLWDQGAIIEAEGLLSTASRAGRFGRYQCEAAIQSVHVQRPITGRLNLTALQTLYELLVTHTDGIGARIGLAVVRAESGDPDAALAELDALDRARTIHHQPFWVAHGHVCALAGRADARSSFSRAIELTQNEQVREFLATRVAELADISAERD